MEKIKAFLITAYAAILVSGIIDLSFWFLSDRSYFVPSWTLGIIAVCLSIPGLIYAKFDLSRS